jgi:hypothetical protein
MGRLTLEALCLLADIIQIVTQFVLPYLNHHINSLEKVNGIFIFNKDLNKACI